MASNKYFFKLGFTLDNYVVTKVGIKFVHNFSDEHRYVGNGGFLTSFLN